MTLLFVRRRLVCWLSFSIAALVSSPWMGVAQAAADCLDMDENCEYWASVGECTKNSLYMRQECRKSCHLCNQPEIVSTIDMLSERWSTEKQIYPDVASFFILHQVDDYMTNVIFKDPFYEPVRDKCILQNPQCAYLAAQGECDGSPGAKYFMMQQCGAACRNCHELSYETRCPYDKNAPVALSQAGQLNSIFERLLSDPALQQYEPKVYSRPPEGPWLVSLEKFLTAEECQVLIHHGINTGTGFERSWDAGEIKEDGSQSKDFNSGRTSSTNWCKDECHNDAVVQTIHRRMEDLTGIPQINYEHLQILKYQQGEYYSVHHDYNPLHIDRPQGVRLLTILFYLNDVSDGGGTLFPLLNTTDEGGEEDGFVSTPKMGKALIWPSVLDESPNEKDSRTKHGALPVFGKEIKYAANAWIHQRDFKTPESQECH